GEKRTEGMLRRHPRTSIVDPTTGQFIEFWIEGILPTDNPLEGMQQWNIYYKLNGAVHQVIHEGSEFNARHPLPGVYTGKIMVLRGSNDKNPSLPGYKWVSYSSDGGFRWTEPKPWTYRTGVPFFSPSACSQLLQHSNGKLYWLGHINKTNPRGNRPRYPVYV